MRLKRLLSRELLWWPLLIASVGGLLTLAIWEGVRWAVGTGTPGVVGPLAFAVGFVGGALTTLVLGVRYFRPRWREYCAVQDMRHTWGRSVVERSAECDCGEVWSSEGRSDPDAAWLYGPYESGLKPGTYLAAVRMRITGGVGPPAAVVVDCTYVRGQDTPTIAARHPVRAAFGDRFRDFDMRFVVKEEHAGAAWEWRVFVMAPGITVEVDRVAIMRIGLPE